MEEKFPGIFFIKSATNEKDEVPGKITIDLEDLHSLSGSYMLKNTEVQLNQARDLVKSLLQCKKYRPMKS
jgi:hypothetical protein